MERWSPIFPSTQLSDPHLTFHLNLNQIYDERQMGTPLPACRYLIEIKARPPFHHKIGSILWKGEAVEVWVRIHRTRGARTSYPILMENWCSVRRDSIRIPAPHPNQAKFQ